MSPRRHEAAEQTLPPATTKAEIQVQPVKGEDGKTWVKLRLPLSMFGPGLLALITLIGGWLAGGGHIGGNAASGAETAELSRISSVEARLTSVEARLTTIDKAVAGMDGKLDVLVRREQR